MTWMGAKTDIATITALDTTGIEDGIAFRTITEKVWLGLDKTSTATVNGTTVWAASPAGRWHLIGGSTGEGSSGGSSNLIVAANIAATIALSTTALIDGTHCYAIAEKRTLVLDKSNSGTPNNSTCWAGLNTACWFVHPSSIIISSSPPPQLGSALIGTTWIWAESDYLLDSTKSVIAYVWKANTTNENQWEEIYSRIRYGTVNPSFEGISINGREIWIDLQTNYLYYAKMTDTITDWVKIVS